VAAASASSSSGHRVLMRLAVTIDAVVARRVALAFAPDRRRVAVDHSPYGAITHSQRRQRRDRVPFSFGEMAIPRHVCNPFLAGLRMCTVLPLTVLLARVLHFGVEPAKPNHSINRTITGRLRLPVIAGYVKR